MTVHGIRLPHRRLPPSLAPEAREGGEGGGREGAFYRRAPQRIRGMALIVVLIVITVLLVASLSLARSMSTANRMSANTAFKQAATQAGEVALANGEQFVDTLTTADTAQANRYYSVMQAMDAAEMPLGVNWSAVTSQQVGNYQVRWIVERMCNVTPVTDPVLQCLSQQQNQQASQKAGSPAYRGTPAIYYRITAQVTGPRSTETYVQSAVSR